MIKELPQKEREEMIDKIRMVLESHEDIVFAYLHGSFLAGPFRDIDLGIYISDGNRRDDLHYELGLETQLEDITGIATDVRVINRAPIPFKFNVVAQGFLLFSRDESLR